MTEPRWNLIAHIRNQIARETYVTQGKLEIVARKIDDELRTIPKPDQDRTPPVRR